MLDLPDWNAFDASAAPPLPEHLERPGRVVVALCSERAREDGWALRSTLDLARGWGESGHKIVVADAMLEAPSLHSYLGVTNTEGVTDAVLFGSSVRRVAKPAPQGRFFFVTAGSPTADPEWVLASDRWGHLCEGFVEAGVALIVFVGADSPGAPAALRAATDAVALIHGDEAVPELLAGSDVPVHFVAGPAPEPEPEPEPEGDPEEAIFEPVLEGGGIEVPEEKGSRGPVVLVLGAIILALVVAATFDLVTIPGISPSTRGPQAAPVDESVPVATSVPLAETTLRMTHSVAVGAFQDPGVAEQRAAALSSVPGARGIVVPVSIDGALFHRVMIDPATAEAEAGALLTRVAAATGDDATEWVVRESRLAFEVGETADLESAQRRVEVLRDLDVPAYILAVDYVNGTTRYRVYAGAYADDAEAEYLQGHLEERGLGNLSLSDRLGRLPE